MGAPSRRRARTAGAIATLTTLLTTTVAAAITVTALGTTSAGAAVAEPPRPPFYEAPAVLPTTNGAVIRSEKVSFLLDPLDATSLVRNASRVLYRTTNRAGEAIAASGTVLVPTTPWVGAGRPPGDRLRARHPGHG